MHQIPGMLTNGYLATSNDNDSQGVWVFDDYSALVGLASYKYIATEIGNATEATWADTEMTTIINGTNKGIQTQRVRRTTSRTFRAKFLPMLVERRQSADGRPLRQRR